jgi:hypothetical protein
MTPEAAEGVIAVGDDVIVIDDDERWTCLKCTCMNVTEPFSLACQACGDFKGAVDYDIGGDAALAQRMHDEEEHAEAGRTDADTALAQRMQDEEKDVEAGRMHSEAEDGLAALLLAGKEEEQEYSRTRKSRQQGDKDAALVQRLQEKEDRAEASRKRSEFEDAGLAAAVLAEEEEQEEIARGKRRRRKEAKEASNPSAEPAMLAAQLCEYLRSAAAAPRLSGGAASSSFSSSSSSSSSSSAATLPHGSIVNYDHAHAFLQRHAAELLGSTGAKDKNEGKSTHISADASSAKILIVYHGTAKTNFSKIVDGNLKVPDGKAVLHATDQGYYGKGVYTSPQKELALRYASAARGGDGVVFVCLALPGRQYAAQYPADKGKPCHVGFDSHYSPI